MIRIFRYGIIGKTLTGLLLLFIFNALQGCYYYKISTSKYPPEQTLLSSQNHGKYIILHSYIETWNLTNIVIENDTIKGTISTVVGHTKFKDSRLDAGSGARYRKNEKVDESEVLNEVHVFVNWFKRIKNDQVAIPFSEINKIDLYKTDDARTFASWLSSGLGIILIIFTTIGYCHYVYG